MRPATLRKGQRIRIMPPYKAGEPVNGVFIRRIPKGPGQPQPVNLVFAPDFKGLPGCEDGITPYSDYDLSRRGQPR